MHAVAARIWGLGGLGGGGWRNLVTIWVTWVSLVVGPRGERRSRTIVWSVLMVVRPVTKARRCSSNFGEWWAATGATRRFWLWRARSRACWRDNNLRLGKRTNGWAGDDRWRRRETESNERYMSFSYLHRRLMQTPCTTLPKRKQQVVLFYDRKKYEPVGPVFAHTTTWCWVESEHLVGRVHMFHYSWPMNKCLIFKTKETNLNQHSWNQ